LPLASRARISTSTPATPSSEKRETVVTLLGGDGLA
jgi:hypothetical protein